MSRIFWIFIFINALFSFDYSYRYILKKDQEAVVRIKKDYLPTRKNEGILKFRWTLFKANKLVLLVDYEGFKYQYLLENKYKRNSVKINLLGDFPTISKQAFAIILFKKFENNKATFDLFIKDPEHRLEARFK